MTTTTTYASLKHREEELLAQLEELRKEIAIAENNIVEKLNTAIQCLIEVDGMTHSYHRCPIEVYCEGCDETIDTDIDLVEIINALQRVKKEEEK